MEIEENIYLQYFIGYSSFSPDPPFDPSLFVEIRKRLGDEQIIAINEKIIAISVQKAQVIEEKNNPSISSPETAQQRSDPLPETKKMNESGQMPKPSVDADV